MPAPRSLSHHHPRLLATLLGSVSHSWNGHVICEDASALLPHAVHRERYLARSTAMTSRIDFRLAACAKDPYQLGACGQLKKGRVCALDRSLCCPNPRRSVTTTRTDSIRFPRASPLVQHWNAEQRRILLYGSLCMLACAPTCSATLG